MASQQLCNKHQRYCLKTSHTHKQGNNNNNQIDKNTQTLAPASCQQPFANMMTVTATHNLDMASFKVRHSQRNLYYHNDGPQIVKVTNALLQHHKLPDDDHSDISLRHNVVDQPDSSRLPPPTNYNCNYYQQTDYEQNMQPIPVSTYANYTRNTSSLNSPPTPLLLKDKLSSQKNCNRIPALVSILYCLLALLLQQSSPLIKNFMFNKNTGDNNNNKVITTATTATTTHRSSNQQLFMLVDASLYATNDNVTLLDSYNFDNEILQPKEPFHHIKMVEFYVAYCGVCRQFKPVLVKFANSVYNWRTIFRVAVIDLSDHSNTLIGSRWSISGVPSLKMYPPPSESLMRQLLETIGNNNADNNEQIISKYNQSMQVEQMEFDLNNYMQSPANMQEGTMKYLDRYVRLAHTNQKHDVIPKTWPNLLAVQETSLQDLFNSHPRPELFLIIDPLSRDKSLRGLNILLDLSSSSAFKSIRYVYFNEAGQLIQDLIYNKEKELIAKKVATGNNSNGDNESNTSNNKSVDAAITRLEAELNKLQQVADTNQLLLVHVERQQTPGNLLVNVLSLDQLQLLSASTTFKSKSLYHDATNQQLRRRRSTTITADKEGDGTNNNMDIISNYIKQTYSETEEDLAFVEALKKYDDAIKSSSDINKLDHLLDNYLRLSSQLAPGQMANDGQQQTNRFTRPTSGVSSSSSSYATMKDRPDMNKAIRYILFTEIQRQAISMRELSQQQQMERLDTLVNLVWMLKIYFPFDDDPSVQFIQGVYDYLLKQQLQLQSSASTSFDILDLKLEMKRLEMEGKRLPFAKNWQLCQDSGTGIRGYPCGLWRLFHTLVAFEHRKNQLLINQLQQQQQQQQHIHDTSKDQRQPSSNSLILINPAGGAGGSSGSSNDHTDEMDVSQLIKMADITNNKNDASVDPNSSSGSTSTSLSLTVDNGAFNSPPQYPSIGSTGHSSVLSDRSIVNSVTDLNNNLPPPVLIVMRDYIKFYFSCSECAQNFEEESSDLSIERIRRQEHNNFSLLWLWRTHNRINKRLSISNMTNDPQYPKVAFPTYDICPDCYTKVPRYIKESLGVTKSFDESIEWNEPEVVKFLLNEYTNRPFSSWTGGFISQTSSQYLILALTMLVMLPIALIMAYVIVRRHQEKKLRMYANGNGAINGCR